MRAGLDLNPILVHLILEDGADPNRQVKDAIGGTIWTRFLQSISWQALSLSEESDTWFQIVEKMILFHADLDVLVKVWDQNLPAEAVTLKMFTGKHVVKLRQSIAKMRGSRKKPSSKAGPSSKPITSRALWRTKLFGK